MLSALILVMLLGCLAIGAAAAPVAKIGDLRIADRQTETRIVFDLNSLVQHNVFVLENPDRVVLDIDRCDAHGKLQAKRIDGALVREIRYAQKARETLRVVFDLNGRVTPKSFLLLPQAGKAYRLVLDLIAQPGATQIVESPKVSPPTEIKKPTPSVAVKTRPHVHDVVIAIDAGHGGKDPGAIGRRGTREKDIVLAISKRLKNLIDQEPGMKAVMIRSDDVFVPLRGRIRKASQLQADVFVSIHADAAVDRSAKGSSVYVLSQNGASSEAARILAQRENQSDKIGGVSLEDKDDVLKSVLVDLSQTATSDASIDLAQAILAELSKVGNVLRDEVEQAGFAVLKSPDIPSVLVETAFISNPAEEKRLKTVQHQQKLAKSILKGLQNYVKDHLQNPVLANGPAPVSLTNYTIKHGDTLSGIAMRYQVSLTDLRKVNGLRSDLLRVGQVLTIPVSPTVTAGT